MFLASFQHFEHKTQNGSHFGTFSPLSCINLHYCDTIFGIYRVCFGEIEGASKSDQRKIAIFSKSPYLLRFLSSQLPIQEKCHNY